MITSINVFFFCASLQNFFFFENHVSRFQTTCVRDVVFNFCFFRVKIVIRVVFNFCFFFRSKSFFASFSIHVSLASKSSFKLSLIKNFLKSIKFKTNLRQVVFEFMKTVEKHLKWLIEQNSNFSKIMRFAIVYDKMRLILKKKIHWKQRISFFLKTLCYENKRKRILTVN